MRILAVTVRVDDVGRAEQVYGERLGLPTVRVARGVEVQVGDAALTLEPGAGAAAREHLAFGVPADGFDAASAWIAGRSPLLAEDGRTEFAGPPSWSSRSVYFDGPSGQVLELIARERLPQRFRGPAFGAADLLGISEAGIAVPDVGAAVDALAGIGLDAFGAPGPDFAAVGDDEGLLILVREGRPWLPTADRFAIQTEATVRIAGALADVAVGRARILAD